LDRKLGGPQGQSGHGGEEKNSQPLPGLEPPIIQPVSGLLPLPSKESKIILIQIRDIIVKVHE
jgi:hypothetical protein